MKKIGEEMRETWSGKLKLVKIYTHRDKIIEISILESQIHVKTFHDIEKKFFNARHYPKATTLKDIANITNENIRIRKEKLKKEQETKKQIEKNKKKAKTKSFWLKQKMPRGYKKLIKSVPMDKDMVISKSPYGHSYYFHNKNEIIDWGIKPEGSLRVSDHWNFGVCGEHCPTENKIYEEKIALAKMEGGIYKFL